MTQKVRKHIAFLSVFAMLMAAVLVIPSFWGTAGAEDAWDGITATEFDSGDGSEATPYLISNGEQLAYLAQEVNKGTNYENTYFKLTDDINLGGKDWTPIGKYELRRIDNPFKGVFDGNGKTISNLSIDTAENRIGLFGYNNGGTIKNLALTGTVKGGDTVGGICGINSSGTISGCSFSGSVSGDYGDVGGICGYNGRGSILNCINSAKVDAKFKFGGISGGNYNEIRNCVNLGEVSSTSSSAGGICGHNESENISDCYFDKTINSDLSACGDDDDKDTVKGLSSDELCGALPAGFDNSIWQAGSIDKSNITTEDGIHGTMAGAYISLIDIGEPAEAELSVINFGTDNDPDWDVYTLITTPEEFKAIGDDTTRWAENYVLGNDIDFDGAELNSIGNGGANTTRFTGKFSGDGHVVSNFVINTAENTDMTESKVGLFGKNDGKIVNLGVEKAEVTGISYVGAVCGDNNGIIRNCYSAETKVTGVIGAQVGGVCGNNEEGTITSCYNTGEVSGNRNVGGVCGSNGKTVEKCYNTGAISGEYQIGGVCGGNSRTIRNCYNTGAVSGNTDVGGVCGLTTYKPTVENCYSIGAVSGDERVGGVCGYGSNDAVKNCYYSTDIFSGGGIGNGASGSATGLPTVELCYINQSGFDRDVWADGSLDITDAEDKNFRTQNVVLPSLKGVGEAYKIDIEQYDFGINESTRDWDVYTLITTAEEFQAIGGDSTRWAENYVLGNDIAFKTGTQLTPIGNSKSHYTGKFSGNGYVLSDFVIPAPSGGAGLFGYNDGLIENLGVENAEVTSILGNIGGICGVNQGKITYCYFTGKVSGQHQVGGVCGLNDTSGTITSCYSTAEVTGIDAVGGVCGVNKNGILFCYSSGEVSGDGSVGGVCGINYSTITSCYYNKDMFAGDSVGWSVSGKVSVTEGLSTGNLCATTSGFDFYNTWDKGSLNKATVDEKNEKFRTVVYNLPSLKGVGNVQTVELEQYDFGYWGNKDWDIYTLITTPAQFKAIVGDNTSWNENYVLGADIAFDGEKLTPIGGSIPFRGKFSGDGHIISDFIINEENSGNVGLFGRNLGLIENLGVKNAQVTGKSIVGGICGENDSDLKFTGVIVNCYNTGDDKGSVTGGNKIGGVCGESYGSILNCYNTSKISGDSIIGGVCGANFDLITNCYNIGDVSGNSYAGGVCGANGSDVDKCYNAGAVSGTTNVGAVCGYSDGTVLDCYYNKETCGVSDTNAVGLATTEICSREKLSGFDFTSTWLAGSVDTAYDEDNQKFRTLSYVYPSIKGVGEAYIVEVKQYDFGYDGSEDWDVYTLISKPEKFKAIGDEGTGLNKNYVLGNDIVFADGTELTPIGNDTTQFTGKFSGDGHILSNFRINKPDDTEAGLFRVNDGRIMNVGIEDAEIIGGNFVGGFCGVNYDEGIIINCYNAGKVSGNQQVGGICGSNLGTIKNSYNTGAVSGSILVGGVCASNNFDGVVENCYGAGAVSGNNDVGGVCGFFAGSKDIANSYYNKDICTAGDKYAIGLTTFQMTDSKALEAMNFGADWDKQANDKENGTAYYPDLAVFANDKPSVKYESKLVIELSDKDAEYKYGDKISFDVSALIKFDGMPDFAADTKAGTDSKGSFTVTVGGDAVVDSTDIFDNTKAAAVIPSIKVTGKKTFKLVYDGTNSEYIADGTATCKVSIAKLTLTADDFDFTAPTGLTYNGTAKEAEITARNGITGIGEITVKYYKNGRKSKPINAGEYTVKIDVAEGDIYYAASDLTADGWKFTIDKAAQTIDVPAEYALTYGETGKIAAATDGDGAISYAVKSGDDVISVAADGTIKVLKAGTAAVEVTAAETENYTRAVKTVAVNVKKAAVTIIANSYTIKVGAALPDFDYEVTGLVNGDTLPIKVTISCSADVKTEGEYPIVVSGAAESADYTFSYTNGTLIVSNKKKQTITAEDVTLTYGETGKITASTDGDGAISYAVKSGDDVISVAADGTVTALKSGTATVEITAAETEHYTRAVKTVTITVNRAAVIIKANSYTIKKGESLPAFGHTVTGLVNGDTLGFAPEITCAANTNIAGTYDIKVTLGITEDERYTYAAQNGTLTVENKSSGGSGGSGSGGSRPSNPSGSSEEISPSINGVSKNWSDITSDISKSAAGSVIIIQLNGNTAVPADVIRAIADRDSKVTFIYDSVFSWIVDGAEITAPAAADLSVIRTANTKRGSLRGTEGTQFKISNTNIPSALEVSFRAEYAGKFANLYKSADGRLVFVTCAKSGTDGKVLLPGVTSAGDYIVMLCEYSDRPGDMNNDGVLNAMDASAVLKDIVGLETGANPLMADFNGDGQVNALDASAILKKIVGLI